MKRFAFVVYAQMLLNPELKYTGLGIVEALDETDAAAKALEIVKKACPAKNGWDTRYYQSVAGSVDMELETLETVEEVQLP